MSRAVVVREHGGPEALKLEDVAVGPPGPGEVKVRHEAIGLNFVDVYQRTGLYKLDLPATPGGEAVGIIQAVGEGVTEFEPGDRVGYATGSGAYADERLITTNRLVRIPDFI